MTRSAWIGVELSRMKWERPMAAITRQPVRAIATTKRFRIAAMGRSHLAETSFAGGMIKPSSNLWRSR